MDHIQNTYTNQGPPQACGQHTARYSSEDNIAQSMIKGDRNTKTPGPHSGIILLGRYLAAEPGIKPGTFWSVSNDVSIEPSGRAIYTKINIYNSELLSK